MNFQLKTPNYRHVLPDVLIIAFSFYISLFLRVGEEGFQQYLPVVHRSIGVFLLIRLATFATLGVYDIIWRYISVSDILKLGRAIALSTLLVIVASFYVDIGRLPRATFVIDTLILVIVLSGIRVARRLHIELSSRQLVKEVGRYALIYGAGKSGRSLAQRFSTDEKLGIRLLGFIDDDPQKVGRMVGGVRVLGALKDLSNILRHKEVKEIFVATRGLPGHTLRELVQVARQFQVRARLIPGSSLRRTAETDVELFRNIELSDLLNRPKIEVDLTSVKALLLNKRVLITGAGGSIGSELARQIASFSPSSLMLLDHSEFSLYQIDTELRKNADNANLIVPILADIKDIATLKSVMAEHSPEVVFHAAAYKHVHLVEANPYASILNNVLGTRNLLDLSMKHGVGTFVLISTDKAVNPVGIMGATKRVCELMVTACGNLTGRRYCAVRFGNVLGSSGSLIPLLRKQILKGEPVTITHQDMTRYFMLIPEAVSLVLKAATIARPGDISILRMGEPLKILDVAKSLIAMMGKSEDEVPIVFTGLRPGEKMFEELYLSGNELNTEHPDILLLPRGDTAAQFGPNWGRALDSVVEAIIDGAQQGDRDVLTLLKSLIKGQVDLREESVRDGVPGAPIYS